MKVKELIEALQACDDQELEVMFTYNYGDRGRTEVAQPVKNVNDSGAVVWSEYHRLDRVVSDFDEDEKCIPKFVVLLS